MWRVAKLLRLQWIDSICEVSSRVERNVRGAEGGRGRQGLAGRLTEAGVDKNGSGQGGDFRTAESVCHQPRHWAELRANCAVPHAATTRSAHPVSGSSAIALGAPASTCTAVPMP